MLYDDEIARIERVPCCEGRPPRPTRRAFLGMAGLLALGGAAGCQGGDRPRQASTSPSARTSHPNGRPSPSPSRQVTPWSPSADEALPRLKTTAARFVEALTAYEPGARASDVMASAAAHLHGTADTRGLLREAEVLLGDDVQRSSVHYVQYAGLSPLGPGATEAAVMVLLDRARSRDGEPPISMSRTLDVRLVAVDGEWRVTALASAGGQYVARPRDLSPAAQEALDDPRVVLPDTARWDVHAGRVSNEVLALLTEAAAALGELRVTVLLSGHPRNVFATPRVSEHAAGRAVDIWSVAGRPVVSGTGWQPLVNAALRRPGVAQIGSPPGSDRDGPRSKRSFADLVHDDHVHLAVRAPRPSSGADGRAGSIFKGGP